jgi:dihydrofolate synthase/folylpolyglutamate synthase
LSLGNEVSAMKLGLENIGKLLTVLGNPQNNYLKVQVAGTNGKGSVCAFLDAICISAGIKTGLYTSPHLVSITERIKIGGNDITEEDFARQATLVRNRAEKLVDEGNLETVPTFFEQVTAIALNYFAEQKVDLAILETGLGGRFDATTAANAEIAAITRIDYDHQNILGNSLAEIATEKAAVIHEGSKVVIGEQNEEAMRIVLKRCTESGIEPTLASKVSTNCCSGWFKLSTERGSYKITDLGLKGRHQIENAKVAILLSETLQENFAITAGDIVKGLETAKHAGRLEFHGRFLFDGAHNIGGSKALREYLDEFIHQPITMVFGTMRDKDISEIAAVLFPKAKNLILTKPENTRSVSPNDLMKFVPEDNTAGNIYIAETVGDAIDNALTISSKDDLICVTGSLYLVGEAKKYLGSQI